jgi:GGDEF domain-containing protein
MPCYSEKLAASATSGATGYATYHGRDGSRNGGYRGAYLQADTILYSAKREGRNRLAFAPAEMAQLAYAA